MSVSDRIKGRLAMAKQMPDEQLVEILVDIINKCMKLLTMN